MALATCAAAQPTPELADEQTLPDLVAIRIEAESLKNEQMAVGRELLSQFPESFHVLRMMGYIHSTHGNLDAMADCWKKCQQLKPERPDIYDQLGRYYLRSEQYDKALEAWRKTLALDSKYPGVQRRLGVALIELGQADQAAEVLRRQIALTPKDPESHYQLGEALFQKQEFEQAKAAYRKATELSPRHSKAVYGLVKTNARLGNSGEAAKHAEVFQELEEDASKADAEYRESFDDLQKVRSDVAVTFVDAGRIYASEDQLAKALRMWERAAEIDARNQMARNFAAKVYLSRGQRTEALRHLQQLAEIDPKNPRYHEQVGMILASTGQTKAAEQSLRRVVRLAPREAGGYRLLAKFYLNTRQRSDLAYDLARTAVRMDPTADSYFVLGWASADVNKLPDARAALEKAMKMDPQNVIYRKLYESLRKRSSEAAPKPE